MPQAGRKLAKTNLADKEGGQRRTVKQQRKGVIAKAVKKKKILHQANANAHLSKVIHKNIEQMAIAKALADKPGILKIAKPVTLKKSEQLNQRKTLERKARALGSTEISNKPE